MSERSAQLLRPRIGSGKSRRIFLSCLAVMTASGVGLAVSATPATAAGSAAPDYRPVCQAPTQPGTAACMSLIRTDVTPVSAKVLKNSAPVGYGYGPSSLQSAYDLPSSTGGVGQSVAVVDAYNDPDAVSDLATYRSSWGLSACNTSTKAGCLTVVNENGASSPLPANSGSTGWSLEESLDVDMVSATCPNCHIYLVEANSAEYSDLGTGVNSAVSVLKVDFISNSYGGSDSSSDSVLDADYYKHPGVAITASAGDDGYFGSGVLYPASSQYVTAVGGTTLKAAKVTKKKPRGWAETVWGTKAGTDGTGSGCSSYETKPSWQSGAFDSGCANRTNNDVSADANPDTGVAVYDVYDYGGWVEVGGTSEASPIIASVFALAGTPKAGTYPTSYIYAHTGDLYDVTKGTNGSPCSPKYLCKAGKGYDGPTGWGTPDGTGAFT
jgi:subtilase family serine protease